MGLREIGNDLPSQQGKQLRDVKIRGELAKIMQSVGITVMPDETITGDLVGFIIDQYGYLELWEISRSVDFALAGKFNVGKDSEGLNHYNNLSKKYLAFIFNSYLNWKRTRPPQLNPEERLAIGNAQLAERALYDNDLELWMRNCIVDAFYRFKEKYTAEKTPGKISTLNYQYVEWLWKHECNIQPYERGYEFYKQKALSESMIQDKRGNIVSTLEHPDGTAKRLLITDWFIELIEKGNTLFAIDRTIKIVAVN